MTDDERVVVLIDMDCFFCQVEEKLNPELKGKPIAVVQYNPWQGGGIIAVNYIARALGVTRHMRGHEAKTKCPEIELPSVPCVRGKADISKYRDAGKDVAHVLQEFTPLLERASVDEAYLDITEAVKSRINSYNSIDSITEDLLPNTYILGYDSIADFKSEIYNRNQIDCEIAGIDQFHSKRLLVGAIITCEIRAAVYERTGYQCSAGIAHNKILAKLVCGMNKPNKQTVLPKNSIQNLYQSLPVGKIKHLGGKFGDLICKTLNITMMDELNRFTEKELQKRFNEKNGSWLYDIARGIDKEPVVPRFNAKSIGCCKKFAGKAAILDLATLSHWLKELASEIQERLSADSAENSRYPTQMVVSFTKQLANGKDTSCSRSVNMSKDDIFSSAAIALNAITLIRKDSKPFCVEDSTDEPRKLMILANPVKFLGISVGKFAEIDNKKGKIREFFGQTKIVHSPKSDSESCTENLPTCSTAKDDDSTDSEVFKEKIDEIEEKSVKPEDEQKTSLNQSSFIVKYLKKLAEPAPIVKEPILDSKTDETKSDNIVHYEGTDSECSSDRDLKNQAEDTEDLRRNTFSIAKFFNSEIVPEVDSNVSRIFCDKCQIYIDESESSVHSDFHFALSLKQEEKKALHEDRKTNQVEVKTSKKHVTIKSTSKRKRVEEKGESSSIVKMFSKINNQIENEACEDANGEKCPECDKIIQKTKFQEHLDRHEARKLHMELNKREVISKTESFPSANKKKKIPIKNVPEVRKINSFFQR